MGAVPVIEAREVRRRFRTRKGFLFNEVSETDALRGVDLSVNEGEIFGLLGPNGAGKTTLTKILTTLLLPTSGHARVLGLDVVRDALRLRPRIGLVLGGERGLYPRVTARENLRFFADLFGLPSGSRDRRVQEVLETVGLADSADRRVEEFSRGMKQKLHLARGILHRPEVLFLDEPTIGLDPKSAREARKLIRRLVSSGVTIFLTTHYMFEAEELCQRVAVLSKGRIVASDTVAGLSRLVGGDRTIEVEGYGFEENELHVLRHLPGVSRLVSEEFGPMSRLTLRLPTGDLTSETVRSSIPGHPELAVRERRTSLEDIYLDLVEEEAA